MSSDQQTIEKIIARIQRRHPTRISKRLKQLAFNKRAHHLLVAIAKEEGSGHHMLGHVFELMTYADESCWQNTTLGAHAEQAIKEAIEKDPSRIFQGVPLQHSPDRLWFLHNPITWSLKLVGIGEVKLSSHGISEEQLQKESESVDRIFEIITMERARCKLPKALKRYGIGISKGLRRCIIVPRDARKPPSLIQPWELIRSTFYYQDVVDMGTALLGHDLGDPARATLTGNYVAYAETTMANLFELLVSTAEPIAKALTKDSWTTLLESHRQRIIEGITWALIGGRVSADWTQYQKRDASALILQSVLRKEQLDHESIDVANALASTLGSHPPTMTRFVQAARSIVSTYPDGTSVPYNILDLIRRS